MHKRTVFGLLSMALFVIVITGCNTAATPDTAAQSSEMPAIPVEVLAVSDGNISSILNYSGDLQPVRSLSLVSIVSGAVEEVKVNVGDIVRAGDPIMRVEDTTYKAQLKQAEAGLTVAQSNLAKMESGARQEQIDMAKAGVDAANAQLEGLTTLTDDERTLASANYAQAEAALRLAQYEYDKIKWADQVGRTPQALQLQQATIAFETAKAAYDIQANPDESTLTQLRSAVRQAELNLQLAKNPFTENDFAVARAGVSQAEGVVALAQYQVDNVVLRAPFDGIIAEVYSVVGSVASPQFPVVKLIAAEMEVTLEIPENDLPKLYVGQPAALKVAAYPGQDFPAYVDSIAPTADTTSHTFTVKVSVPDETGLLHAGMFADVSLLLEERAGVILVPRSALTTVDGQSAVYVVSADEQSVVVRPVTTGLTDDGHIEITDGLSVGETIVTVGLTDLSDGSPINITTRAE